MLERDIEKAVCDYAKSKGLIAYKFTSPNRRSVPDRLFCGPGNVHFFIEFKAPGKKPTAKQQREIDRLQGLGHHTYACDNIEVGKSIVQSETAHLALSLPEQGDRVFGTPRSGDDVAGHGPRKDRGIFD
jgi:hypothetical protein